MFQEGSKELEMELEAQLEQMEIKNKEIIHCIIVINNYEVALLLLA